MNKKETKIYIFIKKKMIVSIKIKKMYIKILKNHIFFIIIKYIFANNKIILFIIIIFNIIIIIF